MIGEILKWSLMASGIILMIMLIRRLLMGKMTRNLIYALWVIVLIRLLVPVLPSSKVSIFNLFERNFIAQKVHITQSQDISEGVQTNQGELDEAELLIDEETYTSNLQNKEEEKIITDTSLIANNNFLELLGYIWLIGCISVIGYFSYGYYKLSRKIKESEEVIEGEVLARLQGIKVKAHIHTKVRLVKGTYPMIFGCFKPTICIPTEAPIEEVEMMLYHELLHLKYRDNKVTYLQILALSVHWFNPLVWWAMKLMKADMEIACDERVIRLGISKKQYAKALLNAVLAPRKELCLVQSMGENQKHMKERIMQITLFKKHKISLSIIGGALLVAIILLCLTNATTPKTSETVVNSNGGQADTKSSETSINDNEIQTDNIAVFGVDESGMLTDAIFVINLSEEGIKVTSIPRDTKVEWDEEQRKLVKGNAPHFSKLNEMQAYGGSEHIQELAIKEIEEILKTPIQNYAIVNLSTVEKLIDNIGGLEINIPQDMRYMDSAQELNIDIKAGKQTLTGKEVLGALRYRRYADGDLGRISMQQYVMKTLAEEILKEGDISKITMATIELMKGIQTNIRKEDVPHYIEVAMKVNKSKISFEIIPGEGRVEEGKSYYFPT